MRVLFITKDGCTAEEEIPDGMMRIHRPFFLRPIHKLSDIPNTETAGIAYREYAITGEKTDDGRWIFREV